jgi:hypothetical protein
MGYKKCAADPAFFVDADPDPDPDPGFMTKNWKKISS